MSEELTVLEEVHPAWRERLPQRALIFGLSEDLAPLVQALLEDTGWHASVARGPGSWLQEMRRVRPSVAICDLDRAGIAGLHLAREIRQDAAPHQVSLIGLSAWCRPHVVRAATLWGFNYLLQGEPLDFRLLEAVTAGYGARHGR